MKNLLISLCGYEIEMREIPEKYVKEITTLVWGFIWGGGINHFIDRKVCCLGVENGGMSMINIQEFIDSKRIKLLYQILHEPLESWNAIGKYWLRKLDIKFSEKYFVSKGSNSKFEYTTKFLQNMISNHGQNYRNLFNCVIMTLIPF